MSMDPAAYRSTAGRCLRCEASYSGFVGVNSVSGQPSDVQLVELVSQGDQGALARIYERYGGAVRSLALRVGRDPNLADEVSQTVFTALWSAPERFDPQRGSLRTWLLTQAHARTVDALRSESARRRREDRQARLADPPPPEVEAAAQLAVRKDSVRRAVEALPESERDAILLTYFRGYTYREAAELLGQPEGTVKSRIRAGLRRLRSALEAQEVRRDLLS